MASALVAPPTPHYYYTFTFHFAPRRTQAPQFHISLRDHPTSPLVNSHLTLSSHAHDALHFHFSLRPHAISALPASARNSHLTYDFLRVFTFHFSKNANVHVSLSGQKLGGGDLECSNHSEGIPASLCAKHKVLFKGRSEMDSTLESVHCCTHVCTCVY